jgi:hypothetical protein
MSITDLELDNVAEVIVLKAALINYMADVRQREPSSSQAANRLRDNYVQTAEHLFAKLPKDM